MIRTESKRDRLALRAALAELEASSEMGAQHAAGELRATVEAQILDETDEPILKGIEVEGRVDPETGAGVDALARRLTEKLGRAGQLPPKAQTEFDARERS